MDEDQQVHEEQRVRGSIVDEIKGEIEDNFREAFKYFKRKRPTPDLSRVLDVRCLAKRKDFTELKPFSPSIPDDPPVPGLKPIEFWKVFSFDSHPGFLFIVNPFLPFFDRIWAKRCLKDYTCKPNHCNLDAHESHETDLWHRCIDSDSCVRQTLLSKLRWVTFGYHHNWDTKVYSLDNGSSFPLELSHLTRYVANAVGFNRYLPEAAIVNYYPVGSTLSGHTDHSEFDLQSPIISFSFGSSAIFLLGGATKSVKPLPIYIHSGDIVVMFGSGRLNYHGIPRIIPDSWHPCPRPGSNLCHSTEDSLGALPSPAKSKSDEDRSNSETFCCILEPHREVQSVNESRPKDASDSQSDFCDSVATSDESLLNEYLRTSRINVNVRQVFIASNAEASRLT